MRSPTRFGPLRLCPPLDVHPSTPKPDERRTPKPQPRSELRMLVEVEPVGLDLAYHSMILLPDEPA